MDDIDLSHQLLDSPRHNPVVHRHGAHRADDAVWQAESPSC